jgi:DNA-binding CsgD family transcriptional regulator
VVAHLEGRTGVIADLGARVHPRDMAPELDARSPAEAALRSGEWDRARAEFGRIVAEHPDGRAYEGLAQALWWLDDGPGCLEAREAAYRIYRTTDPDAIGAARAATALSYDSLLFGDAVVVARGWWERARSLLDAVPERAEHGWLAVREGELALAVDQDADAARSAGDRAWAIGRRLGEGDLEFVGMALSGLAATSAGDLPSGVPRLDAAVGAATAGEVGDLMWMGKICCWLIIACQETQDLARADEWCRRVEAVCERQHLTPLFAVCRIQHSSILIARGTWSEAERDLLRVLNGLAASRRHSRLDAVVQLGELRRRQGRWAEARELLAQAEFHPSAVVARAMMQLAQGEAVAAWAAICALMVTVPVSNRLARARVLLPAVLAARAAGDRPAASAAADELRAIATLVDTDALLGLAAVAGATLADDEAALGLWREAVRRFHDSGLPFDEAESRLRLAQALLRTGDLAAAAVQAGAAIRDLTSLGASAALTEGATLSRQIRSARGGRADGGLTAREAQVLRLVADGLNNRQIADALVLSPHTVHRHVANILSKLDQPTRAGAAVHAVSLGLL